MTDSGITGAGILNGACVAVTGGANGIGRAIAEHLARAGARVAIADIDLEAAQSLATDLGGGAIAVALDVSDETAFIAFLDAAEDANGPLAVMVNNAGIDWMGPFHEVPNEVSRRELAVNLMGTIIGSRLAIQRMLPRGRGHLGFDVAQVSRILGYASVTTTLNIYTHLFDDARHATEIRTRMAASPVRAAARTRSRPGRERCRDLPPARTRARPPAARRRAASHLTAT